MSSLMLITALARPVSPLRLLWKIGLQMQVWPVGSGPQMEPYLGGAITTENPLGACLENSGPVHVQSFPLFCLELVGTVPYRLELSPDFQKF